MNSKAFLDNWKKDWGGCYSSGKFVSSLNVTIRLKSHYETPAFNQIKFEYLQITSGFKCALCLTQDPTLMNEFLKKHPWPGLDKVWLIPHPPHNEVIYSPDKLDTGLIWFNSLASASTLSISSDSNGSTEGSFSGLLDGLLAATSEKEFFVRLHQ